jgi:hypothetical protein
MSLCCGNNLVKLMKEKKIEKTQHEIIVEDLEDLTQEHEK